MKNFLILLLGLASFFPAYSQDSTVCISPSTARYFLEIHDEALILREKDSISNELIFVQSEQLLLKDQIIDTYRQDSTIYQNREATYTQHIELIRSELNKADKEIKKQRFLKFLAIGLAVLGLALL